MSKDHADFINFSIKMEKFLVGVGITTLLGMGGLIGAGLYYSNRLNAFKQQGVETTVRENPSDPVYADSLKLTIPKP